MTQEREALEAEMARFGDGRMLPIQWIKGFERGWLGRKKYEAALAAREEPPGVNEDREVTSEDADRCGRIMIGFGGEGSHHPTCKLPKGHDGACSEAALAAREEPQEFILPARFSRDDLQSDQAFHAAEEVLTGTFGEPSPEEAHADLYGQIIDAVCDDLAAREDTERPEGHRRWTLKQTLHGKHLLFEIEDGPALPIGECVDVTERANGPERELYLARREPPGMGLNVIDGAHSDEEGVARAAKLHARIFSNKAGEGPAVMVEVFPVPDLDPPINEDAADACREMVRDAERKPK